MTHSSCIANYESLLMTIKTEPSYKWADNEHFLKPVNDAMQNCKNAMSPMMLQFFMNPELKEWKKKMDDANLLKELEKIPHYMDHKLKDLNLETKRIVNMASGRSDTGR